MSNTQPGDADFAVEMTVADCQAAFAAGLTSEALTKAFLARIETYNPTFNAYITMNAAALDDARAIDRRRAGGEKLGPLAGVPIAVKDPMDMAGEPSTGGWHFLSSRAGGTDLIPATDSPVVARMRAAGCVILGKTNIPVLSVDGRRMRASTSWDGPTFNAVDRADRIPGASSASSAAPPRWRRVSACRRRSLRRPAARSRTRRRRRACVGVKPTFALIPNTGVAPLAGSTRDVVGPISGATCVDAALTPRRARRLHGRGPEDGRFGIGKRPKGGYTSLA